MKFNIDGAVFSLLILLPLLLLVCMSIDTRTDEICRERGYDYGVFHVSTFSRLCRMDGKYVPYKDAVK